MARRFAELQAQREAEKAGETASRAEEQRATEALLGDMSQKAEASQAHMQEMLKELAKANEAKVPRAALKRLLKPYMHMIIILTYILSSC